MDTHEIKEWKPKIVISMRCAGYLMLHGCKLVRTEPHKAMKNKNIFIFNDDERTSKLIQEYKKYCEDNEDHDNEKLHKREDWK